MQDNETMNAVSWEDAPILPEGWTEGDDIFAPETWGTGGGSEEDQTARETGQDDPQESEQPPGGEGEERTAPTTEQEAPTTEPSSETKPNRLKFKARVDREDRDVELDEGELPTVWQKAQVTDRVQAKLAELSPRLEQAERTAKALGYDGLDSMLTSMEKNWQDGEVRRLVGEGVHEEVAREMVARRAPAKAEPQKEEAPARDFRGEVQALLEQRPELRGKALPEEVVRSCAAQGKSLLAAYAEYETAQQRAEADRLRRENEVLRKNAANAAKAPVKGVGGSPVKEEPEDDFLRGFNSNHY